MAATQIDELLGEMNRPAWQLGRARGLVLVAGVAVLAVAGYVLFLRGGGSAASAPQTATVQRGPVVSNVSLSGSIAAQSTAELSFSEAGAVTAVHVTAGQQVKAGDLLAEAESKTAQDGVTQAQLNLQSAQIRLNQLLKGPGAAEVAGANESVIQAQSALTRAEDDLQALRDGPSDADLLAAKQGVKQAEAQLAQARTARDKLKNGSALATELAAADASVTAAELGLQQANAKLADLNKPAAASQISTTTGAVEAAKAGLQAAEARRDSLIAGADQDDIALQRNSVQLAQLALAGASEKLDGSRIYAPFDGTVAEIAIQAGSAAPATDAAITMNTPGALTLNLTVSDSDYSSLKVGQKGFATIDSMDGASFPVEIVSLGTLPSSSQGVVTYKATARILDGPQQVQTPAAGAPGAAAARALPLPGMQAQVTLITDQKLDVLTLPSSAVQKVGQASTVQVLREDGTTETVAVKTGLSNGRVVEITEGLEEGQTVVLPTAARSTGQTGTPGDVIIGGGPPGGGGTFAFPRGAGGGATTEGGR